MTICKNPEPLTIEYYTSSQNLPEEWDGFLPALHFLRKKNLVVSEEAKLPDISYIYLLITKNAKPCAAAYFQLLGIRKKHLNTDTLKGWQKRAWSLFSAVAHPKLLVAGHLFRHDITSFYASDHISAFEAYKLYKVAIDKVLQLSCANAVLVKDMPEQLSTYFQHYAPQCMMLRNDISMQMEISADWNDIADYEKALKHKYAQRFRKIRQAFSPTETKELSAQEAFENKHTLYKLYLEVCQKQQARIGYLSEDYLPLLKQQYPDTLKLWAIYEGNDMVAFFSAWVRPDVFDMFYIGFDYNRNAALQLYFNILFFSVEKAISYRKPRLILGRTALDAKARLGCKPHYLSTFVFIKNRYLRNMIQQLQRSSLSQEGEWEQRHPLKTQPH